MRATRERDELQMANLQRHGDTAEPQKEVTTMVVYLGVRDLTDYSEATHVEDPATCGLDNAHGGNLNVTEDA